MNWKQVQWGDECPDCGGGVEILTDAAADMGCDGDSARCMSCGRKGSVTVADIDSAWIVWDDEGEPMNDEVFAAFIRTLNEALAADPVAVTSLCEQRVPCNQALANHPTIQVAGPDDAPIVGLLGIINGICEHATGMRVGAEFDDAGLIARFVPYRPQAD